MGFSISLDWCFTPFCAGSVHVLLVRQKNGLTHFTSKCFAIKGSFWSDKKMGSPFHIGVLHQSCWLWPHCACAQEKGFSVFLFHCSVFCKNSFPVQSELCSHCHLNCQNHVFCKNSFPVQKKTLCLCANKWAVPFHYLVFCTNSFPVLIGIYSLYATMSLSDALMHRAVSFQLGDVSSESSILYDIGQPSMGVKPTCHFVDNCSIGYWIETLIWSCNKCHCPPKWVCEPLSVTG